MSVPRVPSTVPVARTARRLEWQHLPPHVRSAVERRTGSPVSEATSMTSGYTPGLASVLHCVDGSRHFVKAASVRAQRAFAGAYRDEARVLGGLPEAVPAPRLLWTLIDDDWVVLGIEHVEATAPARPWTDADLDRCLAALAEVATLLTPAPASLDLAPLAEDLGEWTGLWEGLVEVRTDLGTAAQREECARLARRLDEVAVGETVVHTDVRDDNILIGDDGRVLLCDWNWPARGPAWVDSLLLLIGPRGDGLDVEAAIRRTPLLAAVPVEDVNTMLAAILGYFLTSADLPVPPTSPFLRRFQQWQADVVWDWLAERRGWA